MMREDEIVRLLSDLTTPEQVQTAVPLSGMTTMHVGGPADVVVTPYGLEETKKVIGRLIEEDVPWVVLGRGSNVLASDIGYDGVVVRIAENLQNLRMEGNTLIAQAGATLTSIARWAGAKGFAGMEFASGIPGTLGGGIYMNAGAYGGEMKDIVTKVRVLDMTGQVIELSNEEMQFGYRYSILQKKTWVVLEAELQLTKDDPEAIKARMKELARKRREKQPLDEYSSGSTFKRPEGHFAGALIEGAGLKGYAVGGAKVSEKHAGFVINTGEANCREVVELIHQIMVKVKETSGVELEPEVRYLAPGGLDVLR